MALVHRSPFPGHEIAGASLMDYEPIASLPRNTSPTAAESQGSHPGSNGSKAGQHFYQIPGRARGSRLAPDEDVAQLTNVSTRARQLLAHENKSAEGRGLGRKFRRPRHGGPAEGAGARGWSGGHQRPFRAGRGEIRLGTAVVWIALKPSGPGAGVISGNGRIEAPGIGGCGRVVTDCCQQGSINENFSEA